jgi:hypothetical protein
MTALVWDQVGQRQYETGVDRGVLYLPSGGAVPWNGLVSVVETRAQELKSYFMDGVKYQDNLIPAAYSAKLQAFTYPKELDSFIGGAELAPGVVAYDQVTNLFNLSYRTGIGLAGIDHGHKVHLVWNVSATPSDVSYNTQSDSSTLTPFEWTLTGAPNSTVNFRPIGHVSFDSNIVSDSVMNSLEDIIYGSPTTDPRMPSIDDIYGLIGP